MFIRSKSAVKNAGKSSSETRLSKRRVRTTPYKADMRRTAGAGRTAGAMLAGGPLAGFLGARLSLFSALAIVSAASAAALALLLAMLVLLAGTSSAPAQAAEDVFASGSSGSSGSQSGAGASSAELTPEEIFEKYGFDPDNPPGYVPQKGPDGNYVMPDLSDLGDRPLPDYDGMAAVDPDALPTEPEADASELPQFDLSDEDMAASGVDPSVIEALKGSGMTEKEEWACTCFLCLANPNGWSSVSECRPPVERLFDYLKKHSMPKCPQAGAGNDMVAVLNPTEPCTKQGLEDVSGWIYLPGKGPVHSSAYQNAGTEYCVSGYRETRRMCVEHDSEGYCSKYASVRVFDQVKRNSQESPYSIDIIVDGQVFNRTHGWR